MATKPKTQSTPPPISEGFKFKLQIAVTMFVPMLALGL